MVGIVGYGAYVPRYRIKAEDIAREWGMDSNSIKRGLLLEEKTVPALDEDTITISVEASKYALQRARIDPQDIGAVYIGSESHPYAVKPSGTVLIDALGIGPEVHTASYEFACKAGTEAIWVCCNLVRAGGIKYGLAIGADTSQGAPGDALEYSASAGGAAFILGKEKVVAEIVESYSYTTDTPDFWRKEGEHYPQHSGRFTGEPAYFKHVLSAAREIMKRTNLKALEFAHCVFHMPNGRFPQEAGKALGFTKEQLEAGWIVSWMGNTYSGSSPTGLCAILDVAKPGDLVLLVSFGSGAGSDAFIFRVTEYINEVRNLAPKVRELLFENRIYIDYGTYAKFRKKIRMSG